MSENNTDKPYVKKIGDSLEVLVTETNDFGKFLAITVEPVKDSKHTLKNVEYWVVHVKQNEPIAICWRVEDAKAVGAALAIAESVCTTGLKNLSDAANAHLARLSKTYDVKKMGTKMRELLDEGKTVDEVHKYMMEHRLDFELPADEQTKTTDTERKDW